MKNEQKIREEVEKTLNAFDNISDLDENPYLITRLKAKIEESGSKEKSLLKGKILQPVILFIIVIFNIFTGIYFFDSGSQTASATQQDYFSKISSEYTLSHSYLPSGARNSGATGRAKTPTPCSSPPCPSA